MIRFINSKCFRPVSLQVFTGYMMYKSPFVLCLDLHFLKEKWWCVFFSFSFLNKQFNLHHGNSWKNIDQFYTVMRMGYLVTQTWFVKWAVWLGIKNSLSDDMSCKVSCMIGNQRFFVWWCFTFAIAAQRTGTPLWSLSWRKAVWHSSNRQKSEFRHYCIKNQHCLTCQVNAWDYCIKNQYCLTLVKWMHEAIASEPCTIYICQVNSWDCCVDK